MKQLVKDEYGVIYETAKAYRDLLHYCGFSYQKAEFVDRRKNNQSQGHFKKQFEKKLKKGYLDVVVADESKIQQEPNSCYRWNKRGNTPVVKVKLPS